LTKKGRRQEAPGQKVYFDALSSHLLATEKVLLVQAPYELCSLAYLQEESQSPSEDNLLPPALEPSSRIPDPTE
jgi:hypothetical protein